MRIQALDLVLLLTLRSAPVGRSSGAQLALASPSGTNQFHGDAFEYLRNDVLDALDPLDSLARTHRPPFRLNQFGGSVGGPIQKDKTFFFSAYEGYCRHRFRKEPFSPVRRESLRRSRDFLRHHHPDDSFSRHAGFGCPCNLIRPCVRSSRAVDGSHNCGGPEGFGVRRGWGSGA